VNTPLFSSSSKELTNVFSPETNHVSKEKEEGYLKLIIAMSQVLKKNSRPLMHRIYRVLHVLAKL
jgi:hypothetical protein